MNDSSFLQKIAKIAGFVAVAVAAAAITRALTIVWRAKNQNEARALSF